MQNAKRNWKTTLGGVLTLLGVISYVLKAINDGTPMDFQFIITSLTGAAVGLGLIAAKDGNQTGTAASAAALKTLLVFAVGTALLVATPARAQQVGAVVPTAPVVTVGSEVPAAPPFHTLSLGKGYSLSPIAGMGGTVYDIAHNSVARSYRFGVGGEFRKDGIPVGLALCGNLQVGDIIAGSGSAGVTLADDIFGLLKDTGLGFYVAVASKVPSYGPTVFRVFRF